MMRRNPAELLRLLQAYRSDCAAPGRLADAASLLPECCLKRLDASMVRYIREAARAVTQELRAARLASAIVRWVVATVQGAMLSRRERQLSTVAHEILRCRFDVPAVPMKL